MSKQGKKIAEKALEKLGKLMTTYNEVVDTISQQKALQTLDYDSLLKKLEDSIKDTETLAEVTKKNKIEIENLDSLISALKDAMLAYKPVVIGLGNKANRRAKYGWFKYRKDLSKHDEARKVLARRGKAFWANVETTPAEPSFIKAKAYVLDPMADDVLEEEIEILDTQYDESEKDSNGYIFVIRAYEDGKPNQMTTSKETWEAMKVVHHGGTKKEQEKAMRVFSDIDKKYLDRLNS